MRSCLLALLLACNPVPGGGLQDAGSSSGDAEALSEAGLNEAGLPPVGEGRRVPICGDALCETPEDCTTCAEDGGCVRGVCDPRTRRCSNCLSQCGGRDCGSDGCGGSCGACTGEEMCDLGRCVGCIPECGGRQCGPDGCEGSCGTCPGGFDCIGGACVDQLELVEPECLPECADRICGGDGCGGLCGVCGAAERCHQGRLCEPRPICGDGRCHRENCASCPADCGACCGDGECVPEHGEHCGVCEEDCACTSGQRCTPELARCVVVCLPQCGGRECGTDGCDADCGTCAEGLECVLGQCE